MLIKGILLFVIISFFSIVDSYKILGIFPTMSPSHYFIGSALMKGLARKGHDVTIVAPFTLNSPMKNVREIRTTKVLTEGVQMVGNIMRTANEDMLGFLSFVANTAEIITNLTLSEVDLQKLLQSNETFDLVVLEGYATEALFGIAHRFNAPVVQLTTAEVSSLIIERIGSPKALSHIPHAVLHYTNQMNFRERLTTFVMAIAEKVFYDYCYLPRQEALYNKFFPDPKPQLNALLKNTSLALINTHFSIGYPRPYAVNMIEVGGLHIEQGENLPDDIRKFLDDATDGAIYFSLGSNIQSASLHNDTRNAILAVFKSAKQRVLWKWEDSTVAEISENILVRPWFPQRAILAHPNLKLFVSHGGFLSVYEAIYHAVPLIAIPLMADQPVIAMRAQKAGYAIALQLEELTNNTLATAISEILTDDKYSRTIQEVSLRFRDQPTDPLERAIYWVEYVVRHKGAAHMRSGVQNLSFMEYHNLDVYGVLLVVVLASLGILIRICSLNNIGKMRKIRNKIKIQ